MKDYMKIIMAMLFAATSILAVGQSVVPYVKLEQTVKGTAYEGGAGYDLTRHLQVGAFYQTRSSVRLENSRRAGDPFFGMFVMAPFMTSKRITVNGILRSGLVNEQFFVVVPSIETRISILKHTGLGVATSYRHGYPAASLSAFHSIGVKKQRRR
jgi:hypothetical protein